MTTHRLEVWGDPIGHSRSPVLHAAAYRELGLDWLFTRREVPLDRFDRALSDASVRGLAVTYPLKQRAHDAAPWRDQRAAVTGAANTLLPTEEGLRAYNTDVGGIVRALDELDLAASRTVRIVGAGATTISAVAALAELGVAQVEVAARRPEQAAAAADVGTGLGLSARGVSFDAVARPVDLTIATLPGGAELAPDVTDRLAANGGVLFDVAYSPWPSALASAWPAPAHRGLGMLLHQAVLQVRIFLTGNVDEPLPDEPRVVSAMRDALG